MKHPTGQDAGVALPFVSPHNMIRRTYIHKPYTPICDWGSFSFIQIHVTFCISGCFMGSRGNSLQPFFYTTKKISYSYTSVSELMNAHPEFSYFYFCRHKLSAHAKQVVLYLISDKMLFYVCMCGAALHVFAAWLLRINVCLLKHKILLYMLCKFTLFGALVQFKIAINKQTLSDFSVFNE